MFYVSGLVKYDPMRASSYLPSPKELKAKQRCVNTENNDEKCFLWSILASLHPLQYRNHLDRFSKYREYEDDLNMSRIQYPTDRKDISKFEHQNNISVNVYGYKYKNIFLLPITTMTITRCYVLIKDLSRLVLRQYNNYKDKKYFCQQCLHGCTSEEALKNHLGSSPQKLTTRRGVTKSSSLKQTTNCVYLLSSTQISKAF